MNTKTPHYMLRNAGLKLLLFFMSSILIGQEIKKEVYVVSSFRPEVADFDKISNLPAIDDTVSLEIEKDYTVLPSRLKTPYSLRPIKSATMVGTSLDKLYKSYIKLGIGNYTTPLLEYSIHNLRSKEYSIGAYAFHKSSHTNQKLDNSRKVTAGFVRNEGSLYGKYFFDNAEWSADAGIKTHLIRYYGINTTDSAIFPDSIDIGQKDIKQTFLTIYGQTRVTSTVPDSSSLFYTFGLKAEYFKDYFSNTEPHYKFDATLSYLVKGFKIGIDGVVDLYQLTDSVDTYKDNLSLIRPFMFKRGEEWEIKAAAKIYIDTIVHFFPEASLRLQVIKKALIAYFGVAGSIDPNSYQHIAIENPFVLPALNVQSTKHKFIAYAGLEGLLSRNAGYRLDFRMDATEDSYFFVNDTISEFRNQFNVVYDDADLIQYYGEVYWAPMTYLTFLVKSHFYDYRMTSEDKPWHKPAFDLALSARYNFKEKIFAEVQFTTLGKRYARNFMDEDNPYELDQVYDMNVLLEYKYSNILSAFVHFYNLFSQEYYLWNQYPSQRINIMVGLTYKF